MLLGYLLLIGLFVGAFSRYYIPEKGFSYLISFGGKQPHRMIDEMKNLDYYVMSDSEGYDAQYYVQIAMRPDLRDPQLLEAVDSLPYRARRILIGWVSYAMGLGQPEGILTAYVMQNALCWLLLAGVLCWWFPPTSWNHFLRWAGVLFSFGMCASVRNSLVDGPSLLLLAVGVMLLEMKRPWWSTAVFAISGLGKETNILGAASLVTWDDAKSPRRWPVIVLRGLLVALPLALWLFYINRVVGPAADMGSRNFDWPTLAYLRKWGTVWTELHDPQNWALGIFYCRPLISCLMLVALTTQFLFLLLRPRIKQPWWRIGMSFSVLMLVLGDAVWEGYPGAASRVLLPMQLAFNVLVPLGRAWWPILILGNLTLLTAPVALQPPVGDGYKLSGAANVISSVEGGRLRVKFGPEWHEPERFQDRYWRWSRGSSNIVIQNPHAYPLESEMDFILSSLERKEVAILDGHRLELWRGTIEDSVTRVHLTHVVLQPGDNTFRFITDDEVSTAHKDPRKLSYCVKDWVIKLRAAPHEGYVLTGPAALIGPVDDRKVTVGFGANWFEAERQDKSYWRWTGGPSELVITNHHDESLTARLNFVLNGISKRTVTLSRDNGLTIWEGEVSSRHSAEVDLSGLKLVPGENHLFLRSNLPPSGADDDKRLLDLSVKNMRIEISR